MSTDMGILDTKRPEFDPLLTDIARYASEFSIESERTGAGISTTLVSLIIAITIIAVLA